MSGLGVFPSTTDEDEELYVHIDGHSKDKNVTHCSVYKLQAKALLPRIQFPKSSDFTLDSSSRVPLLLLMTHDAKHMAEDTLVRTLDSKSSKQGVC